MIFTLIVILVRCVLSGVERVCWRHRWRRFHFVAWAVGRRGIQQPVSPISARRLGLLRVCAVLDGGIVPIGGFVAHVGCLVAVVGGPTPFLGQIFAFAREPVTFVGEPVTFVGEPVAFVGGLVAFVGFGFTLVGDAVAFVGGLVAFVSESLALFEVEGSQLDEPTAGFGGETEKIGFESRSLAAWV
ncbi:hypothetical protein [Actinopolymorpha cephalotaxi]|uniref:hypothetical protein n=1 Tax=Actinopolymorpha cephalotaxi TaxID=504797 RepID=UPI003626BE87